MDEIDLDHLNRWLGRATTTRSALHPAAANRMAATLDRHPAFQAGDPLPPAWHWLYFHEPVPTGELGDEGHARLGGFLPPVPLPRRMWAGGSLTFERPLRFGRPADKRSTVKEITLKEGRTGQLCFVTVEHAISQDGLRCLHEEQTLVYREAPPAEPVKLAPPPPRREQSAFSDEFIPTPIILFRYSALTFNSHRIHYDLRYAREVEGYPDLVVHGPLAATLLLDLFRRQFPGEPIHRFSFRALSPLFLPHPFTLHGTRKGKTGHAWAADPQGTPAMRATIEYQG